MIEYLPLLNVLVVPVIIYIVRHEKCHARIELLLKQICSKLNIINGS